IDANTTGLPVLGGAASRPQDTRPKPTANTPAEKRREADKSEGNERIVARKLRLQESQGAHEPIDRTFLSLRFPAPIPSLFSP
ncbi:MAG: hypothetical protein KDM63_19915, partial [Verrucomicrobiae bacterium]|nr:hypothetical protein [Verrucomicrobiae bacterium]